MKILTKILAVVIALVTVFTSSMVFAFADDPTYKWPSDPVLTYRDDFDWGSVMHAPSWGPAYSAGNLEQQLHQLAEMGGKLLRVDATGNVGVLDKTVKLCNAYGIKVLLIVYLPSRTFDPDVSFDVEEIETHFRIYAKRYDGNSGCGKADYIQLDNEMDVGIMGWTSMNGYGTEISEYPEDSLKTITEQVKAAVKGIRNGNPNVKIIINIAFVHYGLLKYFQQNGVEWDITGHDWYTDMLWYGNSDYDVTDRSQNFYKSGQELYDLFGKPIIICETNMWTNAYNGSPVDEEGYLSIPDVKAGMIDGSYWDPLVFLLEDYYNEDFVIGCTIYEFYDELVHQSGETWSGEAHFGMMEAGINGLFIKAKPIYYRCKRIFGGDTVEKLDWEKVEAMYEKDDGGGGDDGDNTSSTTDTSSSTTDQTGGTYETITKHNYTTVTPDPIIVTPEPINKEVTQTETVNRKIPVSSGKFFTLPIILSFVIGGVAILLAAGAVTYVVIKKKSSKVK